MTIKKKIIIIVTLPFIYMLTGCIPMGDCSHHFIYQGTIKASDSLFKDSLKIRFDNLGDIIFNLDKRRLANMSIIDMKGAYKVTGHFLTTCTSDKYIFKEKDSLSFEVLHSTHIIKTGKFCLGKLDKQYAEDGYMTIINLPVIQIE